MHYCLEPPVPPPHHNLTSEPEGWNTGYSSSAWGGTIKYKCDAGGRNRRTDNYNEDDYELTCQETNNFTTPDWPTCVSSKSEEKQIFVCE